MKAKKMLKPDNFNFPQYVKKKIKNFRLDKIKYNPLSTAYLTININGNVTDSFLKQLFVNLNCSKWSKSYVKINNKTYTMKIIRKNRGEFKRNIIDDQNNIILENI